MSNFEVLVRQVDDVRDHPNADRLSLVRILGYEAISAKLEGGSHRYQVGDPVVYVPEAAVLPEDVLKQFGFWNEEKGIGMLAGKAGDRVKAIRLRGILSQGLIFPTEFASELQNRRAIRRGDDARYVEVGDDVAEFLGITKYEPPIPVGMSGEVCAAIEFAMDYDIENWQNHPGFLDNDEVEATEKLHGTCFRICYHPTARHPEIFEGGCVSVSSKGLGAKGLVFKDNEANANVLYVRVARELGLTTKVRELGERLGQRVDLFGEIFGAGVQDLHYGSTKPSFRAFDIALERVFVGNKDSVVNKDALFVEMGVERVPVLYRGPWDEKVLIHHRDGTTVLGRKMDAKTGPCIREGIVVTAVGDQGSRDTPQGHRLRPTLKMVSPDYLIRKGGTEYN
jgi:RNA ligase (TIGR02306 family)